MNEAKQIIETPKKVKAKKTKKMETKALNFWDSVQTKGANKVMQESKYRAELKQLRKNVGMDVVSDYIFGVNNDKINDFLADKVEIDSKYEGKLVSSSIADNGDYIYSEYELEQIEFMKLNSL